MKRKKKSRISDHIRQRTREWFRKAEHEMVFLEHAPFDIEDPPTDTAGKMAHMVAEYSLKAFLVLNKARIPKTHDLVEYYWTNAFGSIAILSLSNYARIACICCAIRLNSPIRGHSQSTFLWMKRERRLRPHAE